MKILHLNTNDLVGGAARNALTLSESLFALGVDSSILVQDRKGENPSVLKIKGGIRSKIWQRVVPYWERFVLERYSRYSGQPWSLNCLPRSVYREINAFKPDIVHLHWICGGFIPLFVLHQILGKIVWTLHDSWLFTGGCHIPHDCVGYQSHCGYCPQLGSKVLWDISYAALR
ncbi:MAG: glycosyltransferase, partial [Ignavibacteria bacterium]|nr:glycosyltransferase [Ignavibacteria bacterium]